MSLLKIIFYMFLFFQIVQVDQLNPEFNKKYEIKVPNEIDKIFRNACWDCHSNETKWPWYSKIAPFSWSIARHVKNGRAYLNFSIWKKYTQEEKDKKLKAIFRTMYAAMPPTNYQTMHKNSIITKEDRELVRKWTGKSPF